MAGLLQSHHGRCRDNVRSFTLDQFRTLFSEPEFVDPLITTVIVAVSSSVACCVIAAPMGWLVARTDMPMTRTIRALVTASFVTPPFLGAVAWEILAAPNSGLLNKLFRLVTGAPQDEYLFNIYTLPGLIFVIACYTFPYVFVLIANALDRIPSDLEDASAMLGAGAWDTARRITIPLALPALLAGALIAFLQAMILFGSPAILALPAGFHTMTTKIWSLFQYPPKPELAAAASLPLLVLTVVLLRGQAMILGRKGYTVVGGKGAEPRLIKLGWWLVPAAAFVIVVLSLPVFLPYFALFNAAFSPIATTLVTPLNATMHNIYFTFFELSSTKVALKNTFILGAMSATFGTVLALVISYLTARQAVRGHKRPRVPRHRADRDSRHRAGRRPVSELHASAAGALRNAVDPVDRLHHHRAARRVSAIAVGIPLGASRVGGSEPNARRDTAACAAHVTAPLLRTSVLATWCFIFVSTIRELSAAVMLFTSETKVVSVLIFDLKESGDLGAISVLGLSMLILTFIVVVSVNRIPGFGAGTRLRNT